MIDVKKLLEDFDEKCQFTSKKQKKMYRDMLEFLISLQPKIEKCGDCSKRMWYMRGYNDCLAEVAKRCKALEMEVPSEIRSKT